MGRNRYNRRSKYMRNPALRIKAFDGSEIHLDKRKQIVKAIEIYSQNKIIK